MRVPIVVREVEAGDERSLLEMALIENIQRENLNPIDEAQAYRRLTEEFHLTQEDIAARVGKDRASVANYRAPAQAAGRSAGRGGSRHAVDGPRARARGAHQRSRSAAPRARRDRRNLSVRETESLVKKIADEGRVQDGPADRPGRQARGRSHPCRRGPAAPRARDARTHRPARHPRAASKSTSAPKRN